MGKMMKKFQSGAGSQYLTRKQALRKLQLSLKMFRRLCILKGIYPREPKNRKKAQRGATDKKTLYLKKDIQFLLREPITWKIREHKVYLRKKSRARALRNIDDLARIMASKPTYSLDHIVKERYPTFVDALRDLDDSLTMCFLFSTMPSIRFVPAGVTAQCRRLTIEFLHYVIEARALRKVFVSVKGYYYQAVIMGQTITWIVPHNYGFQPQSPDDVDFRIMATFVEFYCTLLGFVNFRLYHSLNLCYPPKLTPFSKEFNKKETAGEKNENIAAELLAALNQAPLKSADEGDVNGGADENEEEPDFEQFSVVESGSAVEELQKEAEMVREAKKLFQGLKFFLNREVPREPLTFIIRAFGGQVSWDETVSIGSTYGEDDAEITHQIVDRELGGNSKQHLSRYYVQPQWIFDSVNARKQLKVEDYFPGMVLPAHVSPFPTEREGDYVPIEKRQVLGLEEVENAPKTSGAKKQSTTTPAAGSSSDDDDSEEDEEEEEEDDSESDDESANKRKKLKEMKVKLGKPEVEDVVQKKADESKEEYRLRVMMMKNKHKRLYRKMMDGRYRRKKEADKLLNKRMQLEEGNSATAPTKTKIKNKG